MMPGELARPTQLGDDLVPCPHCDTLQPPGAECCPGLQVEAIRARAGRARGLEKVLLGDLLWCLDRIEVLEDRVADLETSLEYSSKLLQGRAQERARMDAEQTEQRELL